MKLIDKIRDALVKGDKVAIKLAVSVIGNAKVVAFTDAEVDMIVTLKNKAKSKS